MKDINHLFSSDFTSEEFQRRRLQIAAMIGPKASALLQGAPAKETAHPRFSQSKIFYVHDAVGNGWQEEPLKPGMVMVVDPMVWLEDVPHCYVRVEDTIVITEDGCERLTGLAPIELNEIEAVMAQSGGLTPSL